MILQRNLQNKGAEFQKIEEKLLSNIDDLKKDKQSLLKKIDDLEWDHALEIKKLKEGEPKKRRLNDNSRQIKTWKE